MIERVEHLGVETDGDSLFDRECPSDVEIRVGVVRSSNGGSWRIRHIQRHHSMQIADLAAMNAPNDPTFVDGIGPNTTWFSGSSESWAPRTLATFRTSRLACMFL